MADLLKMLDDCVLKKLAANKVKVKTESWLLYLFQVSDSEVLKPLDQQWQPRRLLLKKKISTSFFFFVSLPVMSKCIKLSKAYDFSVSFASRKKYSVFKLKNISRTEGVFGTYLWEIVS